MSTTTLIVIVVIAVVVILILRAKGESRPEDPMADLQSGESPAAPDVRQIAQLVMEGKKIEAIKAYMELSGVGLEEAKNAVERYEPLMEGLGVPNGAEDLSDWSEIDALLEAGDKIGAIKLYREKTGCDLKEAKEAIDIRDNPS